MIIKISFQRAETEEEQDLTLTFCQIMLEEMDDIILRVPDYYLKGKIRRVMTLYGLSPIEGMRIYPYLIDERDNGEFIARVYRYSKNPSEIQPEGYQSMRPELTEFGKRTVSEKKRMEEKRGVTSAIARIVENTVRVETDQLYNEYRTSTGDDTAPWTMKAIYRHYSVRARVIKATQEMLGVNGPDDTNFIDWAYEKDAENGFFMRERIRKKRPPRPPKKKGWKNPRRINDPR